mmetsp:Transcript_29022/g.73703  ORF Transcript_29022/g.73703 Transcript_29022/m.73703 type:complete len:229 (+) Transcript_29022:320-1006(+)
MTLSSEMAWALTPGRRVFSCIRRIFSCSLASSAALMTISSSLEATDAMVSFRLASRLDTPHRPVPACPSSVTGRESTLPWPEAAYETAEYLLSLVPTRWSLRSVGSSSPWRPLAARASAVSFTSGSASASAVSFTSGSASAWPGGAPTPTPASSSRRLSWASSASRLFSERSLSARSPCSVACSGSLSCCHCISQSTQKPSTLSGFIVSTPSMSASRMERIFDSRYSS